MRVRRKASARTADRSPPTKPAKKDKSADAPVHVGHWLKKALAGPARDRGKRFNNLAHELSELIISRAKDGSISWVELLLKRAEDKRVTHSQLAEIIDFVFLVMSKHVKDAGVRAAIYEDLVVRIPQICPIEHEE